MQPNTGKTRKTGDFLQLSQKLFDEENTRNDTTSVTKLVNKDKYFQIHFSGTFFHFLCRCNMFLRSSKSGGMKTQTMSLGFQCSNCPFKSSSKKGIKVWKNLLKRAENKLPNFLKVHENRIHGKDKQVFGTGSSSAATSSSVHHLNPSNSIN